MKSVYKKLVNFQDAVNSALSEINVELESEIIDLREAEGRILSRSIYTPRNNPPFNRSTMDGYAVRAADIKDATPDNPVTLSIVGESFIGDPHKELSGERNCLKISTGAIVPAGSDSVVKVESTEDAGNSVKIYESISPSDNIAESGSDTAASELLLMAGREIETNDIAVLASLGMPRIEVFRKLKVNVISTGNELVSYTERQVEGQINDANGIALTAELNSYGCIDATYSGIVRDDYRSISDTMNSALKENDLIILSGGSSAGEADLVYRIIEEYTPGIIFHGVLVKPGLPTVLGKKGGKAVIGLPGFPVSALMIFRSIFFNPILKAASSTRVPDKISGRLGTNLRVDMGKQNLVPVSISDRGTTNVYPVTGLSGSISRFTSTSGFISIPGTTKFLERGSEVEVTLWRNRISRKNKIISGMFLKQSGEFLIGETTNIEFYRMLPRDAIRSVANGDSDISVFYAESGFDLRKYVDAEAGNEKLNIFKGPETGLVIASINHFNGMDDLLRSLKPLDVYCGPALRLLRNIVSNNGTLRELVSFIENHLPNYFSSDYSDEIEMRLDRKYSFTITGPDVLGNSGYNALPLTSFSPVFVVSEKSVDKFEEIIHMEKFRVVE